MTDTEREPGMWLRVDGHAFSQPVHDTLQLIVVTADGETAELQVARHGPHGLVVIAAGDVHSDRDQLGFARLRIEATR